MVVWESDGEVRGEQVGLLRLRPRKVSWLGPHIDSGIVIRLGG